MSMRKLSRDSAHRRALFRNQVTSLIEHERIETTVAKAKELRRVADRMINHGKIGALANVRKVYAFLQTREAARKLVRDVGPRFVGREGGYTRVLKTRRRRGDCAPMAVVELVGCANSILTRQEVERKEMRKSKWRRRGIADAVREGEGGAGVVVRR